MNSAGRTPLWNFQAGGPALGNAISYEFAGKQYVVLSTGRALMAFGVE